MVSTDTYYIIVTVIFGVFVLLMLWFLYRYMKKSNVLNLKHEELSDDQKTMLYQFCAEMKRSRIAEEEKKQKEKEDKKQQQQSKSATSKKK